MKKAARAARLAASVIAATKRAAATAARKCRAGQGSGNLFDGKEIRRAGQLIGYWRYRGGRFVAEYLP